MLFQFGFRLVAHMFVFLKHYLLFAVILKTGHAIHQTRAYQAWQPRGIEASSTRNHTLNSSTVYAVTTSAPAFHCVIQDQEPGLGIASPYCECGVDEETQSWPCLTPKNWLDQNNIYSQCAYTEAPVRHELPHTDETMLRVRKGLFVMHLYGLRTRQM